MQCAHMHARRSRRTGYTLSCASFQRMRRESGPACSTAIGVVAALIPLSISCVSKPTRGATRAMSEPRTSDPKSASGGAPHAAVALIGGTGEQGLGLACRFAAAGRSVVIGSRTAERGQAAADDVRKPVPQADVRGFENAEAARAAAGGIVILSVPFEHTVPTLRAIEASLGAGTVLVSMGVPLATAIGDVAARTLGVSQGSCAELVRELAPEGVAVVSAFQNVSAHRLLALDETIDCDVIVSGPVEARKRVMA